MKKPKQTNSTSSPVFYLNCMLAVAVILVGVVYQFFVKPDGELEEIEGGLGRKTEDVFDEIPPYPLFTADELAQYDGESEYHVIAVRGYNGKNLLHVNKSFLHCRKATTVLSYNG